MIEDPPLIKIARELRSPTDAQLAAFQGMPTGFVGDAMDGRGVLDSAVKPLEPGALSAPVCGVALTVETGPADVLAAFVALKFVRKGTILMIACGGYQGCAVLGDRGTGMLKNGGGAALVTDGPVRDYDGITAVGLPVWCTGLTPATPFTKGPGTIGLPVHVGGQRVATGDIVVADRDGVVVVPFDDIDRVAAQVAKIEEMETALDAKVAAGLTAPPWADELLAGDTVHWVD